MKARQMNVSLQVPAAEIHYQMLASLRCLSLPQPFQAQLQQLIQLPSPTSRWALAAWVTAT